MKSGSHFDLAMAIGLLYQTDSITVKNLDQYAFIGELSLNGELRACRGILPMIIQAGQEKVKHIIVPVSNMQEAKMVRNVKVHGFENMVKVIKFLERKIAEVKQVGRYKMEEEKILGFADVRSYRERNSSVCSCQGV